jgi:DHA2 family methylenomycin A resistance protein-like MFS transporter
MVDSQTSYLLLACIIAVLGFGLASVLPAMTEAAISHAPRAQSGIASGMLNVSRQVGGVLGVAILGTLVGNQQTFLAGMHLAFVIAGGVLVLALVVAWVFMSEPKRRQPKCENSVTFGDSCLLEQSDRINSEIAVK